jgi:hypothetical protein
MLNARAAEAIAGNNLCNFDLTSSLFEIGIEHGNDDNNDGSKIIAATKKYTVPAT